MKGYPSIVEEDKSVGHLGIFVSSFFAGPYCQEKIMGSAGVRGGLSAGGGGAQLGAKLRGRYEYASLLTDVCGLNIGTIIHWPARVRMVLALIPTDDVQ